MSTKFSAHPDLAIEQLQRAELTARQNSNKSHAHHRRHHSAGAGTTSGSNTPTKSAKNAAKQLNSNGVLTSATAEQTNFSSNGRAEPQETHFNDAFPRLTPVRTYNTTTSSHTQQHVDALDNKFAYNTDGVDVNTMVLAYIDDIDLNCDDEDDDVYITNANSRSSNTKDCVDCTPSTTLRWSAQAATAQEQAVHAKSVDEPDYLQHRFSRTADNCNSRHPQLQRHSVDYYTADPRASPIHAISDGCASGVSSALSSPSASTVSSPLSTPTRLAPHFLQQNQNQPNNSNCCQKSLASGCCGGGGGGCGTSDSDKGCNHQHHHLQHLHHQHQQHQHTMTSSTSLKSTSKAAAAAAAVAAAAAASSSSSSGCKKSQKYDPRLLGPSRYRQLLPVVLCILSFAIVFSILIVYMDTTGELEFRFLSTFNYKLNI